MRILAKVLGRIFSRFFIMSILILFQFTWIGIAILRLGDYAEWTFILFNILSVFMALFVIYRDDNPAYKMGWILIICMLPLLGATMYVMFGNKRPSKRIKVKIDPVEAEHRGDLLQEDELGEIQGRRLTDTIKYISEKGPYPAWEDTETKYYPLADMAFKDMLVDLKKAESFIFMEYFIINPGYMWDEIFDILKIKVKEGVDVRIIYDDVGSIKEMPVSFYKKVKAAGIKIHAFNPLRPIASFVYNNRDHRKMTIIDGYIGYNGGFNIADEYINRISLFGHWKDTGIRLEGKAVWNQTVMFLNMWNAFEKTESEYEKFRPENNTKKMFLSDGIVQPFSDTPLDDEQLGENVYMELINQASEYVYIFTPYLILDNEMATCMQMAAKRGVDVRIVTPGIPDKKIVFRLTRSYYKPLIESGVKIYEYTPGFIHAKSILSDDTKGIVGTINFDYRSLFLHFECATLMIGSGALFGLKEDYNETFKKAKEITLQDCRTGFLGVLFDGVLRAMSPLM